MASNENWKVFQSLPLPWYTWQYQGAGSGLGAYPAGLAVLAEPA
jgi:hypothetical protein